MYILTILFWENWKKKILFFFLANWENEYFVHLMSIFVLHMENECLKQKWNFVPQCVNDSCVSLMEFQIPACFIRVRPRNKIESRNIAFSKKSCPIIHDSCTCPKTVQGSACKDTSHHFHHPCTGWLAAPNYRYQTGEQSSAARWQRGGIPVRAESGLPLLQGQMHVTLSNRWRWSCGEGSSAVVQCSLVGRRKKGSIEGELEERTSLLP